ncbi:hypothetical protein [Chitinophaga pinensis]|uniref:hypothetical protein n=1 Tax=Chitinophaga pinensis TaxID=79329 RepID=UPI0011D264BA|nr:hypothetical protein [Chitinophaga pinensis]
MFFHASAPRHAATEENARPLPDHNLLNTLKYLRLKDGAELADKWGIRDGIFFAACTSRYHADPEWILTLPVEELKWLCAEFDMVLLSDRVTHHWTNLNTYVHVPGRVHFLDLWPDDFFLLPGRNALGIAAQLDKGLYISDNEFPKYWSGLRVLICHRFFLN